MYVPPSATKRTHAPAKKRRPHCAKQKPRRREKTNSVAHRVHQPRQDTPFAPPQKRGDRVLHAFPVVSLPLTFATACFSCTRAEEGAKESVVTNSAGGGSPSLFLFRPPPLPPKGKKHQKWVSLSPIISPYHFWRLVLAQTPFCPATKYTDACLHKYTNYIRAPPHICTYADRAPRTRTQKKVINGDMMNTQEESGACISCPRESRIGVIPHRPLPQCVVCALLVQLGGGPTPSSPIALTIGTASRIALFKARAAAK